MIAKIIPIGGTSETCRTCRHRDINGYCTMQEHVVPDNYVCSWWQRYRPVIWQAGKNQEGA
jgi:hypothetical protein